MIDIIKMIRNKFISDGIKNVYSTFDAVPLSSKGKYSVLIGMKNFEYSTPVYSQYTIYMPFRAEIDIKILAPESSTMEEICNYYEQNVSESVNGLSGLNGSISGISIKHDKNIGRLVLSVAVSAGGMKKIQRETEVQA